MLWVWARSGALPSDITAKMFLFSCVITYSVPFLQFEQLNSFLFFTVSFVNGCAHRPGVKEPVPSFIYSWIT